MKILYVSAIELDADGGPKTHIIEMLREWHKLGHEIVLLTPPYSRKRLNLRVKVVFYPFFISFAVIATFVLIHSLKLLIGEIANFILMTISCLGVATILVGIFRRRLLSDFIDSIKFS